MFGRVIVVYELHALDNGEFCRLKSGITCRNRTKSVFRTMANTKLVKKGKARTDQEDIVWSLLGIALRLCLQPTVDLLGLGFRPLCGSPFCQPSFPEREDIHRGGPWCVTGRRRGNIGIVVSSGLTGGCTSGRCHHDMCYRIRVSQVVDTSSCCLRRCNFRADLLMCLMGCAQPRLGLCENEGIKVASAQCWHAEKV